MAQVRGGRILVAVAVTLGVFVSAAAGAGAPTLRLSGNHLVDASGGTLRLFAVHLPGSEYTCVSPLYAPDYKGYFVTPVDDHAMDLIRGWHVNAVRIPLNEQCWLGVNPVKQFGGPNYRVAPLAGASARHAGAVLRSRYRARIQEVVARAHRHGLAVILDLHWTAAGKAIAWAQWPVPDRQYSIPFWRSVAATFRHDPSIAFEIFNEPFRPNGALSWSCLRDGCREPNACADCGSAAGSPGCGALCPNQDHPLGSYRSAGTQELVNTIRRAGARQPILVPGLFYTNDLSQWLAYMPRDPLHQLAAAFHAYQGLPCDTTACWDSQVASLATSVPVITTEFGGDGSQEQKPCTNTSAFDVGYMSWADAHGVSYTGFSWDVDFFDNPDPKCSYDLLADDNGTPRYGQGQAVHDHFVAVGPAP